MKRLALLSLLALSSCGQPPSDEAQARASLENPDGVGASVPLCILEGVDLSRDISATLMDNEQKADLQTAYDAGLVAEQHTSVFQLFALTELGSSFYPTHDPSLDSNARSGLCFGEAKPGEFVSAEPQTEGDRKQVKATFTPLLEWKENVPDNIKQLFQPKEFGVLYENTSQGKPVAIRLWTKSS